MRIAPILELLAPRFGAFCVRESLLDLQCSIFSDWMASFTLRLRSILALLLGALRRLDAI
ncbi:hypothetical protein CKO23_01230 [Thiocystis violacea]|nr:hypothetical protein [Thiocystis violacea]